MTSNAAFFRSPSALRAWLAANHKTAAELWIGFYKVRSGKLGVTYRDALDEAHCFGWIDGRIQRIDDLRHRIRFTPRRPGSVWSVVNRKRVRDLMKEGRMKPAGLEAYRRRDAQKQRQYSYQRSIRRLSPGLLGTFKQRKNAWEFFSAQPPSYRRVASLWVMAAKQDATRRRRLAVLMMDSAAHRRLDFMTRYAKR